MTEIYENPFSDYGNIINGNRFIGRKDDLKVIERRTLYPKEGGNLAIIGEPRIGKSSLVWKAVMDKKDELIARRLLSIWLNLANFDTSAIFFRALVTECYDKLADLGWLNESIIRTKERALEDELSWSEGYGRMQRFFEKIKQAEIRILFILDEFDHARILFKNDISGFQGLRELSYRPEWRVNFITTSRRTIRNIEMQTDAISTLDGIFHKHYLSMFTQDTMEAYFFRLSKFISLNNEVKNKIEFYCGRYPFLLEMLGYELVEYYFDNQSTDIDLSAKAVEHALLDQYDRLIELMKEDNTLTKLLQILFGPVVDVLQTEVDDFLRYGLIQEHQDGFYTAFSQHFQLYLQVIERTVDLWAIWKDTERALRTVIVEKMLNKYGENWIVELEKKANIKNMFDECRRMQQKEEQSFGNRASKSLLDFTYPKQLFELVLTKSEWNDTFKSIFGKDKQYWEQRAQLLSKIRNPLAHNREQVIYEYERKVATGYCEEILQVILSKT